MSRLFISHSGKSNDWPIALHEWLIREGWSDSQPTNQSPFQRFLHDRNHHSSREYHIKRLNGGRPPKFDPTA